MDRKKLVLLLAALVIAAGTAFIARSMFVGSSAPQASAAAAPAEPTGPRVLVANRSLPVGTIITQDAIAYQAWPTELVQDAYFIDGEADVAQLLGTVVRYPITAGEPVTQGGLVSRLGVQLICRACFSLDRLNQSETTSPEMYVFVHLRAIHNGHHLTRNRRFSDHFGDHLSDHFGAKKENPFLSHIFGKTQHFYIFKCFANFKKFVPISPLQWTSHFGDTQNG